MPLSLALVALCSAASGPGPVLDSLNFGMSTALSGPTADLGRNMKAGVIAAFEECNRAGGVHGQNLSLTALDDAYEPAKTAPQMRALLNERGVLGVIGNVGTPTAVAAIPLCTEAQTVFFAPFTGAALLRKNPPDKLVINFRASYAEETSAMVEALVEHAGLKPDEFAFFTQRDAYGDAGYNGGIAALKKHGLASEAAVPHGRYERNSTDVEGGLADIMAGAKPPRAVIMVGTYAPCAKFLKLAREVGLDATFLNVSFVGAEALAKEAGTAAEGVIVTEVVPHPDSSLKAAVEFRAALKASDASVTPNYTAFEGYLAARTLILALEKGRPDPDRAAVAEALLNLGSFDLGIAVPLSLSQSEHQACHTVWPSVIKGGKVTDATWESLRKQPAGEGPKTK